ncbi:glutathione S-transferase N-terminal domain-containing protein [Vibrio neptunius]|uniref:glutathione S-transferase N-terminal domain-containing protein n=1 Tax=Vibrio neptunius TaxID=170651 RepID=UPI0019D2C92C|nr:glutathione S-transferase N-terminal domain-containing protein [Vibrio neptunius]MBN3573161.1 glutathione S-transferase N-terminal domain-containing protein [Vibrio neptunius]
MRLVVGTDSTWSLRAWICAYIAGVEMETQVIDLTKPEAKEQLKLVSPTGLVPALIIDNNSVIHDSLAISEYLNELSEGKLLPRSDFQRSEARSLCCEMHSGFVALRMYCSFTLDKPEVDSLPMQELSSDLTRINTIFAKARLPFMYDEPTVVDAFYAILAYRLERYGLSLQGKAAEYQRSLLEWHGLTDAIEAAKQWRNG